MHPYRALCVLLALATPGCGTVQDGPAPADGPGGSDPTPADGPSGADPATACIGQPFPNAAPPVLTFSGRFIDAHDGSPVPSAILRLVHGSTDVAGSAADADGRYGTEVATGGNAVDVRMELIAVSQGYIPQTIHPSRPFTGDQVDRTLGLSNDARMQLLYGGSSATWDGTAAYIAIKIVDCAGTGIAHAQIVATPVGGIRRYFRPIDDPDAADTDESGIVEILNQPPGSVTITATAPAPFTQLRTYTIAVGANTIHDLDIQP